MPQETLYIGDSGEELVSKFNNNFGDIYNTLGEADTAFSVYNIIDYDCIGDGTTDNTTAFNALLSLINTTQAVIAIPTGRFLIGTCTVPGNIEFIFFGGRIVWKTGGTIVIHGNINAGHKWIFENQSEVVGSIPTVNIHRQEWVSPIWWGGKMDGLEASATTNYNAFRSTWNCVPRLGQTSMGSMIKFPAGTYFMNGFSNGVDGFGLSAKYSDIVGAGKTKTTIQLASGQNKSLWNTYDNFDFNFRDIGFNGGSVGNPTMTDALIQIDYYRVNFENVFITNATADGIYINKGQTNAVNYHNMTITGCGGIAMIFEDVINLSVSGMVDIESCLGIMDLKGTGKTYYDSRQQPRAMINCSIYAEAVTYGIRVFGLAGVYIHPLMYARSTLHLVHLIYDTTDYGYGPRNMPCSNCYVDISNSHDSKVDGSYNGVLVDELCWNNVIVTDGHLIVNCADKSRNLITIFGGRTFSQIERSGDYTGTNYFLDTHPLKNIGWSSGITNMIETIIPETMAYYSTIGTIASVKMRGTIQYRLPANRIETAKIVYFHALIKGSPGLKASVACYDEAQGLHYDFSREIFTDPSAFNIEYGPITLNGEVQYVSIGYKLDSYNVTHKLWFSILTTVQTLQDIGDHMMLYYVNLTDNPNQDLVHIINNTIVGYNNNSFINSTSLPPATTMTKGTKNFCPNLKMEVISDGTNWCKPDGTTL